MANRSFYDIVMVGDFRFPGGVGSSIAEQIRAQAQAGYRTGLLQIKGPILKFPHPFNPNIRGCLDDGLADILDPDEPVSAALLLAFHPQVFTYPPSRRIAVTAERKLLVVNHPFLDGYGEPFYDWQSINDNVQESFGGDVQWAPVGPLVRAQTRGLEKPPPLFEEDWLEVLDLDEWRTVRREWCDDRPVIGRHSRPDPLKWPDDRESILAAYPNDPACRVRILGSSAFLKDLVGEYPVNWDILPFNSVDPKEFLRTIDFFVYFHHSQWVEAFGRVIIEAIANGALAILPPRFEPLLGEAAVYGEPEDVKFRITEFYSDREAYLRQTRLASEIARERFSLDAHVRRLHEIIGPPRKPAHTSGKSTKAKPKRALFLTSNGIGMGHLTRLMAIARRCPPEIQPIFVTMSQAMKVVKDQGFLAEYIPFHRYLKCDNNRWNHLLRREINEIIAFYDVSLIVFDGNVPYGGLVNALADNPMCLAVWCRRAMWRPGAAVERAIRRESAFHAVVEPGEISASYDRGMTTQFRGRTRLVEPIRFLDDDELLEPEEARRNVGLDPSRPAVMVQLGSGNNYAYDDVRSLLFSRLLAEKDLQVVFAEWLIADEEVTLPEGVVRLKQYPLSPYFRAFDFVISAVGYNSFHELLLAGIPTIFVPNEDPSMDEQLVRAQYAEHRGAGLCLRTNDLYKVYPYVESMLDPSFRAEIRSNCHELQRSNGALEVAEFVSELIHANRADQEPRKLWTS